MSEEKVCPAPVAEASGPAVPPLPPAPGEADALRAQLKIVSDRLATCEKALAYCVGVNTRLDALLTRFNPVLQEGAAIVAKHVDAKTGKLSEGFWSNVPGPLRWILGK